VEADVRSYHVAMFQRKGLLLSVAGIDGRGE